MPNVTFRPLPRHCFGYHRIRNDSSVVLVCSVLYRNTSWCTNIECCIERHRELMTNTSSCAIKQPTVVPLLVARVYWDSIRSSGTKIFRLEAIMEDLAKAQLSTRISLPKKLKLNSTWSWTEARVSQLSYSVPKTLLWCTTSSSYNQKVVWGLLFGNISSLIRNCAAQNFDHD